jgi:hypothetical protein
VESKLYRSVTSIKGRRWTPNSLSPEPLVDRDPDLATDLGSERISAFAQERQRELRFRRYLVWTSRERNVG